MFRLDITKSKLSGLILMVVAMTLLLASVALADNRTVAIDPNATDLTHVGGTIATVVNFIRYIGVTLLLGYGYLHSFSLAQSAKNANKRAMTIEALGWTALAVIIFFAAGGIVGVLKGLGSSI